MNRTTRSAALAALLLAGACRKEAPPPLYLKVPVERRDITVSALASGVVEAITVVNVKSRASGTILRMPAQTGRHVRAGDTLVVVDRRDPTNAYNQAQADLQVARANLQNATANKLRMDSLFANQLASQQEHETANLQASTAQSQLVRAQIALQQATDALSDCNVLASIDGVILTKGVDVGTVIASAVNQVSGGTTLLTMADLDTVQLRVQVDETDIGKIQPGQEASITVDAFPNRPFVGRVLKIEPQSTTSQNVTMFPVLIWIPNPDGVLLPGMNAEVEIHVAQRPGVLAIPNAALRTPRDVNSAGSVLGLTPAEVQQALARADSQAGRSAGLSGGARVTSETVGTLGGSTPPAGGQPGRRSEPQLSGATSPRGPATGVAQGGQTTDTARAAGQRMRPPLPEGVTEPQWQEIRRKRQAGEPLTAAESTIAARVRENFQRMGGFPGQGGFSSQGGFAGRGSSRGQGGWQGQGGFGGQGGGFGSPSGMGGPVGGVGAGRPGMRQSRAFFSGSYIVFALRHGQPTPQRVRVGVTDMDYSEVLGGLTEQDTVLLLPSASLVQSQQDMKERFNRMTGGGAVPGMRQATPATGGAAVRGPGR